MKEQKPDMHEAMQSSNTINLPKRDKAKKVWMIIAVIFLVALIGMGVYGYMQMKKLNQQIKDQQAQIDDLNNKKKTLEDAAAAAAKAATDAAAKAVTNVASQKSDEEMVKEALANRCAQFNGVKAPFLKAYRIDLIDGSFAQGSYICTNAQDGPIAVLKKTNGTWYVVSEGLGDEIVKSDTRNLYGIPNKFPVPVPAGSTLKPL